ncbi:MAG: shikimate dehydrogenase [Bacteroidaceae bacterium]|nr:shikimate dehydrogenase [Bacteroidaceae bacterium]
MKQFGLLGHPLGHSFSRAFFNEKFVREGIDAEYLNFDMPDISELNKVLDEHPSLCGLNVTIPYKQAIISYLNELSDEAQAIGAVNVVKIEHRDDASPWLKGFNSDIIGFTDSIRPLLERHHRKALILGTGGASKAVCRGLEKLGIEWRYVSRKTITQPNSDSAAGQTLSYSDLSPEIMAEYTIIINCTPLGMHPHTDSCPEIPYRTLTNRHLLYDLVYNPEITLFMRNGRRQGAKVKNGLEMLHRQALASWEFWNS